MYNKNNMNILEKLSNESVILLEMVCQKKIKLIKRRACNRKNYYKNREKMIARSALWNKNNKEKAYENHKFYYKNNSKVLIQKVKEWQEKKNYPFIKKQKRKVKSLHKKLMKELLNFHKTNMDTIL